MNKSIFFLLFAALCCFIFESAHSQVKIDTIPDNMYNNGIKVVRNFGASAQPKWKERIKEEIYDDSNPRKLRVETFRTRYEDGTEEWSQTVYSDENGRFPHVKTQKKNAAGKIIEEGEYDFAMSVGKVYSGTKWNLDANGNIQEYIFDREQDTWVNKKDLPIYTTDTTDDNTYGRGKKITYTASNLKAPYEKYTSVEYRNSSGATLQRNTTTTFKDGKVKEEEAYFSDKEKKVKIVEKDALGHTTGQTESFQKTDEKDPYSGTKWLIDSTGTKKTYKYDPSKKDWVDDQASKTNNPDSSPENKNVLALGPSWMHFGDKDFHYSGIGATGSFTHLLNNSFGVKLEVGANWHKEDSESGGYSTSQNFSIYTFMAGGELFPSIGQGKRLEFSAQLLAGLASFKTKSNYEPEGKDHSFIVNIGAGESLQVAQNFGVRLQVCYQPTFFGSATQNNIRADLEAVLRL